jgi:thiamine-phosphate diphosphorylase
MPLELPSIYPITDIRLSGRTHTEQVRALVAGGATLIQLREKELSAREFFSDAREAVAFARSAGARIVINDRVDLAIALGADGVHLGQTDLSPYEARKLLGEAALIGFSTHNIEQVREAMPMPIDYFAVGPIFATATKAGPDPAVGLEGIREAHAAAEGIPLVAIGGINETNLSEVLSAGASSAAMIADIVSHANIAERMRRLLSNS